MAVTGDRYFFNQKRFSLLFESLSGYVGTLQRVPVENFYDIKWLKAIAKRALNQSPFAVETSGKASAMRKNKAFFIKQSRQCERQIRSLEVAPDFVFHLFSMYCPFWDCFDIPFAMYLDYTMTLARETWQPWAPFPNEKAFLDWRACEAIAYRQAACIFTFSNLVKRSLVEDYGIDSAKIFAVGASGQFLDLYQGTKGFGSHRILFNGSNFERKGGHLVLAAFRLIKAAMPTAELIIIGERLSAASQPGIVNIGMVSEPQAMQDLLVSCDLLLAPARSEPYGQLLVEALNYGLPCVVSDVGGMPEIVERNVSGLVLAEPTPESLAAAVIELLQDMPRLERYSQAGRSKVARQLNWAVIAEKIHTRIESCLARGQLLETRSSLLSQDSLRNHC